MRVAPRLLPLFDLLGSWLGSNACFFSTTSLVGSCSSETLCASVLAEGEVAMICGYDALMNALLRCAGVIEGNCVHCGEAMELELDGDAISKRSTPHHSF